MRLNYQILGPISETSELNGMKNFAIKNRVLQRDRVLQRRVLERYYCSEHASSFGIVCHLPLTLWWQKSALIQQDSYRSSDKMQ